MLFSDVTTLLICDYFVSTLWCMDKSWQNFVFCLFISRCCLSMFKCDVGI